MDGWMDNDFSADSRGYQIRMSCAYIDTDFAESDICFSKYKMVYNCSNSSWCV